jgi:quercetin dioxygenase-like cupin family protein
MKFLSQKDILLALQRWKERRRLHDIGDTHYRHYMNVCRERGSKPKKRSTYYSWLAPSHENPIQYDDLMALVESLHDPDGPKVDICNDADLFFDFCMTATLEDIALVQKKITGEQGFQTVQADADQLRANRTRIDIFKWVKGSASAWGKHDGHEYLYVISGLLESQFAETGKVQESDRRKVLLNAGDGIAFPSQLFHTIIAKEDSEFAVARPTWTDAATKRQK